MRTHFPFLRIKESLRKAFANLANDFEQRLQVISSELTAIEGPLEVCNVQCLSQNIAQTAAISIFLPQSQQEQVRQIQTRIPALSDTLAAVASAEADCNAANVEENDYTVFTCQDLEFELELVVQSIVKKIAFIDNQVRYQFVTRETAAC